MASWKHKVYTHISREGFHFQVNFPKDQNIPEFEVVVFQHGMVKIIGWDSYENYMDVIENFLAAHFYKVEDAEKDLGW